MNRAEFEELRKQAKELHGMQGKEKEPLSIDAIFSALAISAALNRAMHIRKLTKEEAPEWFTTTLEKVKAAPGQKVTPQRFLMLAGRFPAKREDSLAVTRYLREAGYTPRKSGGNLIFEF